MLIYFLVLERKPLEVDANATVGSVRHRIQELLQHAAKTKGEDIDVDVVLTFNGILLKDDEQKVTVAGIGAGSLLVVLSRALAEAHGRRSGIRCVRQAFKALSENPDKSAMAESVALENCKPFRLGLVLRLRSMAGAHLRTVLCCHDSGHDPLCVVQQVTSDRVECRCKEEGSHQLQLSYIWQHRPGRLCLRCAMGLCYAGLHRRSVHGGTLLPASG